jgi:hypothetical protein
MTVELFVGEIDFWGQAKGLGDTMGAIDAQLTLVVDGCRVFSEEMPVLELAYRLWQWTNEGLLRDEDFEFKSMSIDGTDWFWIRKFGDRWRLGSRWQYRACMALHTEGEIRAIIDDYREHVRNEVLAQLSLDVGWIVGLRSGG